MFNICLECVKLFNIAVHNYDVFRFKFVYIYYTDKLYCLKLIKVTSYNRDHRYHKWSIERSIFRNTWFHILCKSALLYGVFTGYAKSTIICLI